MNQIDKSDEYIAFWAKLTKNVEEILKDYNNLSPENQQRASMEAQRIFMIQGVKGVLEYGKNCDKKCWYFN